MVRTLELLHVLISTVMSDLDAVPRLSAQERNDWVCTLLQGLSAYGAEQERESARRAADDYGVSCRD